MTVFRMTVVLAGGLVLLLAVVVLRAETTRLHYEVSRCERQAESLRQQLLEAELELARLKNPVRLRQRMQEAVSRLVEEPAAESPARPAPSPAPARKRERR